MTAKSAFYFKYQYIPYVNLGWHWQNFIIANSVNRYKSIVLSKLALYIYIYIYIEISSSNKDRTSRHTGRWRKPAILSFSGSGKTTVYAAFQSKRSELVRMRQFRYSTILTLKSTCRLIDILSYPVHPPHSSWHQRSQSNELCLLPKSNANALNIPQAHLSARYRNDVVPSYGKPNTIIINDSLILNR